MEKKPWPIDAKMISNLIVVIVGVTLFFLLFHIDFVLNKASAFLRVLSPFIGGFAIAYLLNAPVRFFRTYVFCNSKGSKGLSITVVYILAFVILAFLIQLVLPQVIESVMQIADNFQSYVNNLNAMVNNLGEYIDLPEEILNDVAMTYREFVTHATTLVTTSLPQILNVGISLGSGLLSGIVTILTAVIASVYMLLSKDTLVRQSKKILFAFFKQNTVHRILEICHRANQIFERFIVGKILDSAIIGVICFVLTLIIQVPFPVLMSVIIGVTNVIPFFGPFFGAVPCLMILLIIDPWSALRLGLLIIGLQQFDGNILGPKILGDSTGISAIWVLISIVVGGGLFGFPGLLLGVPTFAVFYMILKDVVSAKLETRGIDEEGNPLI